MAQCGYLKVLVVDDELPLRQELRLFPWTEHGFELAGEAENGRAALDLCRRLKPDVVIADITMPVMSGLELLRALQEELPAAKVILLTCHSDFEYAREALRLGAVEYLLKVTMDPEELSGALAKAKAAHFREQALGGNTAQIEMKAHSDRPHQEAADSAVRMEIKETIRFINDNLHRPLTLNIVAERVHLSPHYFSRLFKEETGISFQHYISGKRMEKAAELLRTTPLRVYEVAHEVGIPSYRYFAALFREYAGVSPTEYKRSGPLTSAGQKG